MKYPFIFFVKSLPPNVGAATNGPIIRALEKYRDDKGIIEHELYHVGQWAMFFLPALVIAAALYYLGYVDYTSPVLIGGFIAHSLLYLISRTYKLHSEVQAYKVQALYYPDDRKPLFAKYIATYYGLSISKEDALKLLQE